MAATTAVEPTAPADAEAAATGAFSASRPGQPVLSKRDLVTPVMVALILLGLYLNIRVSLTIALLVVLIAVPLGIMVTRKTTRRLSPLVLGFANLGQAAPSLGLLALVGFYFIGFWAVVLILTAYAALSVLRNTIVGLQQVDPGVLDAARGMGMSPLSILLRVELPTAVPVIGAGVRTALVLAVGTVPLGYALDAGGLGLPLFGAIKTNRPLVTFTVAVMIACLALLLDWAGGVAQRAATPRGIR